MADLFISHTQADAPQARELRARLEAAGYSCWMAPDDVHGPLPWAQQILQAIEACKVMVIVISAAANASDHVPKEVAIAVDKDKALLPVRVEDVLPAGALNYLLQLVQWVDAFPGGVAAHWEVLRKAVAYAVPEVAVPAVAGGAVAADASAAPPASRPETLAARFARRDPVMLGGIGLAVLLVLAVGYIVIGGGHTSPSPTPLADRGGTPAATASDVAFVAATPTVVVTAPPTASPTAAGVTPEPTQRYPNSQESALVARLPTPSEGPYTCQRAPLSAVDRGALAILDCQSSVNGHPDDVRFFSFGSAGTLQTEWAAYLKGEAAGVTGQVADCFGGTHLGGAGPYDIDSKPIGQVVCYTSDDAVYYAWTVDSASLMAIAVVSGTDASGLFTWWSASSNWYPTP